MPASASFHLKLNVVKCLPKPTQRIERMKFRKFALVRMMNSSFHLSGNMFGWNTAMWECFLYPK